MLDTQIKALEAISSDEPKKYVYLIAGRPSYDAPPTGSNPMFIIPVRKSDYYVNVGDFDAMTVPKLKKKFDMTRCIGTNDQKVIVPSTAGEISRAAAVASISISQLKEIVTEVDTSTLSVISTFGL